MKVALVYDRINKWGGAERLLCLLHEIFPEAPLYTAVYNPETASWAKIFPKIVPSFLQNFPLAKTHHELYPLLMPLAFESFNFDKYDLVISLTSEAAKGIITKPKTIHLCYCLTPTRYLWHAYEDYFKNHLLRFLAKPAIIKLRVWDQIAAQRPDYYLAISYNVAKRIKKYYRRDSEVVYPPVMLEDSQKNKNLSSDLNPGSYFLVVSRLVPYKRIDVIIQAFNKLGLPLKIIGQGVEEKKLKKIAFRNIEFLTRNLTDDELVSYYQNCRALVIAGEEDFGLVSLEAQKFGRPVIAFKKGGVPETIIEGVTGEFFSSQTPEALIKIIQQFKEKKYNPKDCQKNAQKFSVDQFKERIKEIIAKLQKANIN